MLLLYTEHNNKFLLAIMQHIQIYATYYIVY